MSYHCHIDSAGAISEDELPCGGFRRLADADAALKTKKKTSSWYHVRCLSASVPWLVFVVSFQSNTEASGGFFGRALQAVGWSSANEGDLLKQGVCCVVLGCFEMWRRERRQRGKQGSRNSARVPGGAFYEHSKHRISGLLTTSSYSHSLE